MNEQDALVREIHEASADMRRAVALAELAELALNSARLRQEVALARLHGRKIPETSFAAPSPYPLITSTMALVIECDALIAAECATGAEAAAAIRERHYL